MRRGGLAALVLVLMVGMAWILDSAMDPGDAPVGNFPSDEGTGLIAPSWLAADTVKDGIHLNWRPVPGALAYTLWRSQAYAEKAEVVYVGRDTTFTDRGDLDPGIQYCYRLTATDPEFDESGPSEPKCLVP